VSDFRFRALISVVFQPLCPACSLFLFRRINDDDDDGRSASAIRKVNNVCQHCGL